MKKKFVIASFIIVMLVAGLFTFTGCGDKKEESKNKAESSSKENKNASDSNKITVKDINKKGHTVTFDNSDKTFELDKEYADVSAAVIAQNTELGVEINMYVDECSKADYESYKRDLFKEYTWNGIKGFSYDNHSDSVKFIAELVNDGDRYIILKGDLRTIEIDSNLNIKEVFDRGEIQSFLGTMQYTN